MRSDKVASSERGLSKEDTSMMLRLEVRMRIQIHLILRGAMQISIRFFELVFDFVIVSDIA